MSKFVAVMLYPNIVGRHGVVKSLLITALAVGVIWLMYAFIGGLINGAVAAELKRRGQEPGKKDRDCSRARPDLYFPGCRAYHGLKDHNRKSGKSYTWI